MFSVRPPGGWGDLTKLCRMGSNRLCFCMRWRSESPTPGLRRGESERPGPPSSGPVGLLAPMARNPWGRVPSISARESGPRDGSDGRRFRRVGPSPASWFGKATDIAVWPRSFRTRPQCSRLSTAFLLSGRVPGRSGDGAIQVCGTLHRHYHDVPVRRVFRGDSFYTQGRVVMRMQGLSHLRRGRLRLDSVGGHSPARVFESRNRRGPTSGTFWVATAPRFAPRGGLTRASAGRTIAGDGSVRRDSERVAGAPMAGM